MNREDLKKIILDKYGGDSDFPWMKYPNYEVFRHRKNRKWFALIMEIPRKSIGLDGAETIEVVNFKCDPIMTGSFLQEPGIFPAYHMNKANWLTVALDGSASDDTIQLLLDISYELTKNKARSKKF